MAHTTKMLDNAGSGTVFSTDAAQYNSLPSHAGFLLGVLSCQRLKDRSGLVQVAAQSGLTGSVEVQGRPTPTAAWITLLTITQADWGGDNFTYARVITLMPEIRLKSNITAGSPSIDAWITE